MPGPPREASKARLGPCLDIENKKAGVAAAEGWKIGSHYGCLACQKYTVAALNALNNIISALSCRLSWQAPSCALTACSSVHKL